MRGSFRFLCGWSFEGDGETAYFETKTSHSSWQDTGRSLLLTRSRQIRKSTSLSTMDHHVSWYMLYICGGFYDGYKPVVELLSKPVSMIPDLTHTRHVEVAMLLWAPVRGMACLRQWVHHEIMFRPLLLYLYCINCRLDHAKSDFHLVLLTCMGQIMKLALSL